jgi:hypothetical protein
MTIAPQRAHRATGDNLEKIWKAKFCRGFTDVTCTPTSRWRFPRRASNANAQQPLIGDDFSVGAAKRPMTGAACHSLLDWSVEAIDKCIVITISMVGAYDWYDVLHRLGGHYTCTAWSSVGQPLSRYSM